MKMQSFFEGIPTIAARRTVLTARLRMRSLSFAVIMTLCLPLAMPAAAQQMPEEAFSEQGTLSIEADYEADYSELSSDPLLAMPIAEALHLTRQLRPSEVDLSQMTSLFFTRWQHALLQEAKQLFRTRPPTTSELSQSSQDQPRVRGIRELSVGGIVYNTSDRWTVWLNGQRVTPTAIPRQVLDIKVYDQYIDLKWFDSYSNLIYPVRMRAHQRFNLDSRIFLPGTGEL